MFLRCELFNLVSADVICVVGNSRNTNVRCAVALIYRLVSCHKFSVPRVCTTVNLQACLRHITCCTSASDIYYVPCAMTTSQLSRHCPRLKLATWVRLLCSSRQHEAAAVEAVEAVMRRGCSTAAREWKSGQSIRAIDENRPRRHRPSSTVPSPTVPRC